MLCGAKRRGNPFPARHRRADGTSGTPSPTERFAALRAGRGSEFKPARGIPKRKTTQRLVFLFVITLRFCCSHPRISQGRGSVRGKPLRVSPLAFNHPPAGDRFCAAKSPLQKNTTTQRVVVFFCDCPQVLLSVNQCLLSCFSGDVVAPSSKSVTT